VRRILSDELRRQISEIWRKKLIAAAGGQTVRALFVCRPVIVSRFSRRILLSGRHGSLLRYVLCDAMVFNTREGAQRRWLQRIDTHLP